MAEALGANTRSMLGLAVVDGSAAGVGVRQAGLDVAGEPGRVIDKTSVAVEGVRAGRVQRRPAGGMDQRRAKGDGRY